MDHKVENSHEHIVVKHPDGWFLVDLEEGRYLGTIHDIDVYVDRKQAIAAIADQLQYKVFDSLEEAEQFALDTAEAYPESYAAGELAYEVITHPETKQAACACPEGNVDRAKLEADKWFSKGVIS